MTGGAWACGKRIGDTDDGATGERPLGSPAVCGTENRTTAPPASRAAVIPGDWRRAEKEGESSIGRQNELLRIAMKNSSPVRPPAMKGCACRSGRDAAVTCGGGVKKASKPPQRSQAPSPAPQKRS